MITIRDISLDDNLHDIAAEINSAAWDEDNDLVEFDADSLQFYLERQDTVFLVCFEETAAGRVLLGMASARVEVKPYAREFWLYVDEVDVCADQRKKGAGRQIMQHLISLAAERGCTEVWLGTEFDNFPANALYHSLDPDDTGSVIGYTWETDE